MPYSTLKPSTKRMKQSGFNKRNHAARLRMRRAMQAKPDKSLANWSRKVKERDGYICQRCGVYSWNNHAHHVAPRSQRPDLRLELSNGKTLCFDCHSWVHDNPIAAIAARLLSDVTYESAMKTRAA